MNSAEAINWTHAPNCRLGDVAGGANAFWRRVALAGSTGVLLLHDPTSSTHNRADAIAARQRGYKVAVRAKGEQVGYVQDSLAAAHEFSDVADVLIVGGNEPPPVLRWAWCWYMEANQAALAAAHNGGMQVAAPGWDGQAEPLAAPPQGLDWHDNRAPEDARLAARYYEVLAPYDLIAVHAYGSVNFDGHLARIARWQAAWPHKRLLLSEYGLAARDLIPPGVPAQPRNYAQSSAIKAERCAGFLASLANKVAGAVRFIDRGSTQGWGSIMVPGIYETQGPYGYHLADADLSYMAQLLAAPGDGAEQGAER